jgi:putative methyltransferase (TIGR04325 family)
MTKKILLEILPPFFVKILKSLKKRVLRKHLISFYGKFNTWEEAKKHSTGYDSGIILNKVKISLMKVKNGDAVYERDSVIFDKIKYSWQILANLLWIASRNNNRLDIIDFGGSLGSTYFQNLNYLKHLNYLSWNIVEQKSFVDCGKEYFEDKNLHFFYSIKECLKSQNPDAILLSGVLQYLELPYDFIEELINYNFKYIFFDRTFFNHKSRDILTVQIVPPEIYSASYPVWFLNKEKFLGMFTGRYKALAEFDSFDKVNKGFIFERL